MKLHERLRLARERRGFESARDASDALGVPYGTYSGHENGSRGIKPESVLRYANYFGVSVAWLEHGVGDDIPIPQTFRSDEKNADTISIDQAVAVVEGALLSAGLNPDWLGELREQLRECLAEPLVLQDPRSEADSRRTLAKAIISQFLKSHGSQAGE